MAAGALWPFTLMTHHWVTAAPQTSALGPPPHMPITPHTLFFMLGKEGRTQWRPLLELFPHHQLQGCCRASLPHPIPPGPLSAWLCCSPHSPFEALQSSCCARRAAHDIPGPQPFGAACLWAGRKWQLPEKLIPLLP